MVRNVSVVTPVADMELQAIVILLVVKILASSAEVVGPTLCMKQPLSVPGIAD
jgi:hypothetical protein